MRRVSLNHITPGMRLAKSIYHGSSLILREGTPDLQRYVSGLNNLGIFSIYIDDSISVDIDIPDAISEITRVKCKNVLQGAFDSIKRQGNLKSSIFSDAINILLEELFSRDNILISLQDIGTTDDATLIHSINTTVLCLLIGKQLNLSKVELYKLAEGSLLHDIGKTLLKPSILLKTTPLTKEEFEHIKEHPLLGYELLKKNPFMTELSRIIALQHHERLDGSGYPYGLKSDKLHLFSKITAIADMYDALTAERCYRTSMSNYQAYKILMESSKSKIDSTLLGLLLQNVAIYPNGVVVNLSNGTRGIVKSQNTSMPFRPVIRIIDDINHETVQLYDADLMKDLDITIVE
ncbi:MAG TPA: HD-GYP domain-containing protein [Lachnospiraceae bacterium]|nr:HD-GYP domain-containing protein [Lachnospiraceae bacterium]